MAPPTPGDEPRGQPAGTPPSLPGRRSDRPINAWCEAGRAQWMVECGVVGSVLHGHLHVRGVFSLARALA